MRYLAQQTGNTSAAFNESKRPGLDKLPKALAAKILERDRIIAQRAAARQLVAELGTDVKAEAARQADDEAAAKAARAGKPIPAATATPKLEDDLAKAQRAAQAQEAAFIAIDSECEVMASELYWSSLEKVAEERAELRAEITAKAAALADAVEAAVDKHTVFDWMRKGSYDRTAQTWPVDLLDLERHGLTRLNTTPVNVRDVIIAAATACLDEPEGN